MTCQGSLSLRNAGTLSTVASTQQATSYNCRTDDWLSLKGAGQLATSCVRDYRFQDDAFSKAQMKEKERVLDSALLQVSSKASSQW